MSLSLVQYHSHDCNYTILGLNKKQFSKSKTKKRTKSFFCIINDIQACSQNKTKRLLETGDINCAITAIVSQHATQISAGLNRRIEQTPGNMQKQPQHLQNSQMNTLERRQNTLEPVARTADSAIAAPTLSHAHKHTHTHTQTHTHTHKHTHTHTHSTHISTTGLVVSRAFGIRTSFFR